MHIELAQKLFLASGSSEVSQAVPVGDSDRAQVNLTLFAGGLEDVIIEGSNDLETWGAPAPAASGPNASTSVIAGGVPIAAPSYQLTELATVSTAYIRVKWQATPGLDTILAGGINLSKQ